MMVVKTDSRSATETDAEVDPDRLAYESAQVQEASLPHSIASPVSVRELFFGLLALATWFGLFSGGILISTGPHRAALESPPTIGAAVVSWLIVCSFWTVTNIGLLACVAAFLGALGRRTRFTLSTDLANSTNRVATCDFQGMATHYVSAIMRGFGVYTLVLAGLLVMATESIASPTQASYMRLAPTISIISFYAGFDPSMFADLFDRVTSFLNTNHQPSS